jgi:EpsI family protein
MRSPRYWAVLLLLACAVLVLNLRADVERVPPTSPLRSFPEAIGGWTGRDLLIDPETIAILGKGDFLSRAYNGQAGSLPVTLFIGYFPTQRTGQTIHSPKHCLPGAGWTFDTSRYATILDREGEPYHVGEYVISNGADRQFVVYWYQAHGKSTGNEYAAKARMALDALRLNRTDGALVRVMTPIAPNETTAQAQSRAVLFTKEITPQLSRFIPN